MGKRVIAHAQGPIAIKNAIKAGANSIVHGFFMDEECAEMMVKNNVFLESTNLYVRMIKDRGKGELPDWMVDKANETWEDRKKNFKMYLEKGVKISFGSDAGVPFIRQGYDNVGELRMFVELGMSTMDAIIAATKTAAEAIGIEDKDGYERGRNNHYQISQFHNGLKLFQRLQNTYWFTIIITQKNGKNKMLKKEIQMKEIL